MCCPLVFVLITEAINIIGIYYLTLIEIIHYVDILYSVIKLSS